MTMWKCKHCGRSFNEDLVNQKAHEENCEEYLRGQLDGHVKRMNKMGKRWHPTNKRQW